MACEACSHWAEEVDSALEEIARCSYRDAYETSSVVAFGPDEEELNTAAAEQRLNEVWAEYRDHLKSHRTGALHHLARYCRTFGRLFRRSVVIV